MYTRTHINQTCVPRLNTNVTKVFRCQYTLQTNYFQRVRVIRGWQNKKKRKFRNRKRDRKKLFLVRVDDQVWTTKVFRCENSYKTRQWPGGFRKWKSDYRRRTYRTGNTTREIVRSRGVKRLWQKLCSAENVCHEFVF